MWRRRTPAVPTALEAEIGRALERVDAARAVLDRVRASGAPLPERREAHAALRRAFLDADALLREATRTAKAHSYREWSRWRHRLSQLGLARQRHLFEESDDPAALQHGTIRAIDSGMSGPAIGDHLHGRCSLPGTPAAYGLDLEAILTAPAQSRVRAAPVSVLPVPAPAASRDDGDLGADAA
jgi:hypothetical protein